jgi:hypothetical protein
MDLDVDIENITFPDEEEPVREDVQHFSTLMVQDEIFYYEDTFDVQNSSFEIYSNKLVFERTTKIKSGNLWSTIDTQNMFSSILSYIHEVRGDAMYFSIANMEGEYALLKEKIKELEETLMPPPLMASLVAMIRPENLFQETLESSARVKGISSLIISNRHIFEENIKKRMYFILELWDLEKLFASIGLRIHNTKEYLNTNLKNEEGFYIDGVVIFIVKVSKIIEKMRKQEDLPSPSCIKKLKVGWIEIINVLKGLLTQLTDFPRRKTKGY